MQWESLSDNYEIKRSNEVFKYSIKLNYNSALTSALRWHKNDSKDLNSCSHVHISDSLTFKKQDKT